MNNYQAIDCAMHLSGSTRGQVMMCTGLTLLEIESLHVGKPENDYHFLPGQRMTKADQVCYLPYTLWIGNIDFWKGVVQTIRGK